VNRTLRALPFRAVSALALLASSVAPALAQLAQRPFSVGGGEGGGGASGGVTGWLLAEQSQLTHLIAAQVRALHGDPAAMWGLVGIGFVYGVFHAAGPGHGKAVIASYMMANDRALRRGVVLAFLAALLQGSVAVALVGIAALAFNATSSEMNRAADWLALASYAGIIAIGAWLVWSKGRALIKALRARFARRASIERGTLYEGAPWRPGANGAGETAFRAAAPGSPAAANEAAVSAPSSRAAVATECNMRTATASQAAPATSAAGKKVCRTPASVAPPVSVSRRSTRSGRSL